MAFHGPLDSGSRGAVEIVFDSCVIWADDTPQIRCEVTFQLFSISHRDNNDKIIISNDITGANHNTTHAG